MWRAALPCCRNRIALLGLAVAASVAAAPPAANSAAAPPTQQVWAVALPAGLASAKPAQLRWLAARGVTTVVALPAPKRNLPLLRKAAAQAKLSVIAPMVKTPTRPCAARTTGTMRTCAAVAPSAMAAVALARRGLVDYVVVRVRTPRQLRMLRGSSARRSRLIAVLPLDTRASSRAAWRAGIAYAAADPVLELGVAAAPAPTQPLSAFLSDLPRSRTASATGPAAPTGLAAAARTGTSISLRWTAPSGAVAGYGVYRDGAFVLTTTAPTHTLTGLQCGRAYDVAVDAFDAAGTRSGRASATVATDACTGPAGGAGSGAAAPTDVLPPSAPLGLAATAASQTSISVSWTPSTDNVGVAGYGLYRGGAAAGSSPSTSFSFTGLACATSYALGVDAFDAAGNRSGRTTITTATAACAPGDSTPPSAPGSLTRTGFTTTSITVSWTASTDNVGVAGYGLYRNGSSTGSTGSLSSTFSGLTCGTSYTLGVDAYDAAGNRSTRTNLTTSTSACPPPADTQAPSVPTAMAFGAIGQTTVALAWNASTDNVAVTGYRLFRDGTSVATVSTPGYTYTGLTCGTGYTFAIEAYDAAGNASNRASATGTTSTAACPRPAMSCRPRHRSASPPPSRRRRASRSPGPRRPTTWVSPATASTGTAARPARPAR